VDDSRECLDEYPEPLRGYSRARSPWAGLKNTLSCGLTSFLALTGQKWILAFLDG
jgi:hypothetical protein